jgi:cobalamin synthase
MHDDYGLIRYKNLHKRRLKIMKDWKTTLSGALAALPQFVLLLNLGIPEPVLHGITALGIALLGWFSSDCKNCG